MWLRAIAALVLSAFAASHLAAQDYWIQIEAKPTLAQAEARAEDYALRLEDVGGFYLGGNYYGIVLGPFERELALSERDRLKASGAIPGDSFVRDGVALLGQFYPTDRDLREAQSAAGEGAVAGDPAPVSIITTIPLPMEEAVDNTEETRLTALESEAALSEADRREVQLALEWLGLYAAGIDGAFGSGTREAMREWQELNDLPPTGVMTPAQRSRLLEDYEALQNELGLRIVRSDEAGIEMMLPLGHVVETEATPPFIRYASRSDTGAEVLLLSEPGDVEALRALYQIYQTLEIVPAAGNRSLAGNQFFIEGRGEEILSYTFAGVYDGAIKGFTLVWPADREAQWKRISARMLDSFTPVPGVLEPLAPATVLTPVDMLAGLDLRDPVREATGVYVDRTGAVLTSLSGVEGCRRVMLDDMRAARIVATDPALNLALLRPTGGDLDVSAASLAATSPAEGAQIAVAGYPFGARVPAPVLTFGRIEGPHQQAAGLVHMRLDAASGPGGFGAPVLSADGQVAALVMPVADMTDPSRGQVALGADALRGWLALQGITAGAELSQETPLSAPALSRMAADLAVRVSCW